MDLDRIQRVAVAAAYEGADILRALFGKIEHVEKKGVIDLVTEADRTSERKIVSVIRQVFPRHAILAEESGLTAAGTDHMWLIDPLDGTTNYAHNVPFFAISIAFAIRGEIAFGLVLNPESGELFTAERSNGACLNGHPITSSRIHAVSESLLATGFPYNLREYHRPVMKRFNRCLKAALGVRRFGSAALDLCFVACGRFAGFWEENLNPWDTAAGLLIATEAGGTVTDFADRPFEPNMKEILATNGYIHAEMLELLNLEKNIEDE